LRLGELVLHRGQGGLGLLDRVFELRLLALGVLRGSRRRPWVPRTPLRLRLRLRPRWLWGRFGRLAVLLLFLSPGPVFLPAPHEAAERVVVDRDGARADRVEQRAVVGDEQQRAREVLQRVL